MDEERSVETLAVIMLASLYAGHSPEWSTLLALREHVGAAMETAQFCPTGEGGGVDTSCGSGGGTGVASSKEKAAAAKLAKAKIKEAQVPSQEDVNKAREELALAKAGLGRAGGESRGGSAASRRKQRENLFNEFGGGEKGYVVCPWTGLRMHHTDDATQNPKGYPKFERGKIFTKRQGGGYQLHNLIPESFAANRSRNDTPLRRENLS